MIPLTASLYVEAELEDADTVLVELGTGYYAEVRWHPTTAVCMLMQHPIADLHSGRCLQKSVADGQDYFARKVLLVKEQLDKIGQVRCCNPAVAYDQQGAAWQAGLILCFSSCA